MESFSMRCQINHGCLSVTWYVDESEEWGGSDFLKTFSFDIENTKKLMKAFGSFAPSDSDGITEYIDERFGHDLYNVGLDRYCEKHGIHYEWKEYVDYPGIYYKTGRR